MSLTGGPAPRDLGGARRRRAWTSSTTCATRSPTLMYGVEVVATHPLDLRLIRSLHERLLRGEPTAARTPGEFRTTQNWIGPPGSTLADRHVRPSAGAGRCTPGSTSSRASWPSATGCPTSCSARWPMRSSSPSTRSSAATGGWAGSSSCSSSSRAGGSRSRCSTSPPTSRRIAASTTRCFSACARTASGCRGCSSSLDGVRETAEHAYVQARTLLRQHVRYRRAVRRGPARAGRRALRVAVHLGARGAAHAVGERRDGAAGGGRARGRRSCSRRCRARAARVSGWRSPSSTPSRSPSRPSSARPTRRRKASR